jgi:Flp pilus assembly protein TadD
MKLQALIFFFCILIFSVSCNRPPYPNPIIKGYVERSKCKRCHEEVYNTFVDSHHDLAMEIASEESVLGNFDNQIITHLGDAARFYKKDGRYFVYTKGADGSYADFEVKYTFGWTPLQQYLIEFPRGYYQVLPFCWDSQPEELGGQHWFHIYDQERISPDDVLFWTGKQQNWNHVCAECHSTNLKKNFDNRNLTFHTTWTEIDVSCDACHGPSENHLKWAYRDEKGKSTKRFTNMGYAFSFPNDSATWDFDMEKGIAYRSKPRNNHQEIELCARCHSRRLQIWEEYIHGEPLMQTHIPEVLTPRLYHVDGQIKDEVYVYASILQSTMYQQGVTCTDCHDPHSMQIKAPANILCATCHLNEKYNNYSHHFHRIDSTGGSCKDCHMPENTYMVVDPRQDHSIRIPRPDLSLKIGTPNACIQCHQDQTNEWAAAWFRKWYGNKYDTIGHFGEIFFSAQQRNPEALDGLIDILNDRDQPEIVRASAIVYMEFIQTRKSISRILSAVSDNSPLVRMTAMQVLGRISGEESLQASLKLMNDPIRAVRYEAVLAYTRTPYSEKAGILRKDQKNRLDEYIDMLMVNNDQAATHVNLGILYQGENKTDSAMRAYRDALRIDSNSVEAAVNIADLYRASNMDKKGEELLLAFRKKHPDRPEICNALGLLYIRQKKHEEALELFSRSVELEPQNTYYIYIYGVALNSVGKKKEAIEVLQRGFEINPFDYNIAYTLAAIYHEIGDEDNFQKYYKQVERLQQGS